MSTLDLKWSSIASIIYFSLYALLLLALAFHVHRTGNYKSKKSFLKALWLKRGIYAAILVHLYDTATDVGVIIEWWGLAQNEKSGKYNYETLDMEVFVWTAISFLLLYRVVTVIIAIVACHDNQDDWNVYVIDVCLSLVDMYVIRAVYKAIKGDAQEPTPKQKMIQLAESVFESLPQVVLQSVFIIRSNNDAKLREDSTLYLVAISLIASLFSVTNKYIWLDKEAVVQYARESHLKCRGAKCSSNTSDTESNMVTDLPVCPVDKIEFNETKPNKTEQKCRFCDQEIQDCIGYVCVKCSYRICKNCYSQNTYEHNKNECIRVWYVLRSLWRFSFVATRFVALALVWAVLGGAFIGIFVSFSFVYWFIIYYIFVVRHIWGSNDNDCSEYLLFLMVSGMFAVASLISNIPSSKYILAIAHGIEIFITMCIVTLFAFNDNIDCKSCADPDFRQATKNIYIMAFVISGWSFMIIDLGLYMFLLRKSIILKLADFNAFVAFLDGLSNND
eukprot:462175_1